MTALTNREAALLVLDKLNSQIDVVFGPTDPRDKLAFGYTMKKRFAAALKTTRDLVDRAYPLEGPGNFVDDPSTYEPIQCPNCDFKFGRKTPGQHIDTSVIRILCPSCGERF